MCSFSISCIPHYMFKKEILISGWKKSLNCGLPMISWYLAQAPLNFEAHFLISTLTVAALRYYFFLLSPKFHFAHSLYYFLLMKEKIIDLVFQNVKWEFVIGKEEHLKRNYEWIILMSLYGAWEICHLLMKPSWNHFSVSSYTLNFSELILMLTVSVVRVNNHARLSSQKALGMCKFVVEYYLLFYYILYI